MSKPFYITTTLPYVNADPHVGFAMEIVQADILARYHLLKGDEVFFNTGTDEHGVKVQTKALELGEDTQAYTDRYAQTFHDLIKLLGLWDGITFIRTTDTKHKTAAQAFWKICAEKGDIYKKFYKTKYCIGCELEKTDSELVEGKCPIHPHLEIEIREEENYFFALSKYQEKLVALFKNNPDFVVPASRLNEMTSLIEREGLEDFSISRIKSKMSWGVPVPGDEDHVMYVWFDALVNYISTLGWPTDMVSFEKWWPVVQVAGKDQVRQQAVMWQAMLMSANLSPSKQIFIHGFLTGEGGIKMSKSLGNVINPVDVISEYGADAFRMYVALEVSSFEDSPFTNELFKLAYNANLANGLGNLTSRIMKMAETNLDGPVTIDAKYKELSADYCEQIEKFNIQRTAQMVWHHISEIDKHIQETTPFKLVKTDKEKGTDIIKELVGRLYHVAFMLQPFIPETSAKIISAIEANKMPETSLFLRKD